MDKTTNFDNFIENWNTAFEDSPMTVADLKSPHAIMKALLVLFDRLGIDREFIFCPPPEDSRNESFHYYRDLLPVINTTRILNHIMAQIPQVCCISIANILQPMPKKTLSILLVMLNWMAFQEQRLKEISDHEEELFAKSDQVKQLEDSKNRCLQMLNKQAEEKGKRAERLERLDYDIEQLKQEEKNEKALREKGEQELEAIVKDNHQTDVLLEQKRSQLKAIEAEGARRKALRVYDAEDVQAQAANAARDVTRAEDELSALRAALADKDACLANLQHTRPALLAAHALLHDIATLSDNIKDLEGGDLDSDSKEGELDTLNVEAAELRATLDEVATARDAARRAAAAAAARRHADRQRALSGLREAEEADKQCRERSKHSLQRTEQLKALTLQYQQHKLQVLQDIQDVKEAFINELKSIEDTLMNKVREVEKRVEEKLRNYRI